MWGHSEFPCRQRSVVCSSWSWLTARNCAVAPCGAGGKNRRVVGQEGAGHGGCSFEGTRQGRSRTPLNPISQPRPWKELFCVVEKLPNHVGQPPTWAESCCHCVKGLLEGGGPMYAWGTPGGAADHDPCARPCLTAPSRDTAWSCSRLHSVCPVHSPVLAHPSPRPGVAQCPAGSRPPGLRGPNRGLQLQGRDVDCWVLLLGADTSRPSAWGRAVSGIRFAGDYFLELSGQ